MKEGHNMKRNCYFCPKQAECYTESGRITLKPDNESECDALFTTTEEAYNLIRAIIDNLTDLDPLTAAGVAAGLIRDGYDRELILDAFCVEEEDVAHFVE